MVENKLNERQRRFIEEYLIDLNGTQAAIRAGYSASGANVQAHRMLTNANVAKAIARAKAERSARIGLHQDRVLLELSSIGFARMKDFARWGPEGFELETSDLVKDDAPIKSIRIKHTVTVREDKTIETFEHAIQLHDKLGTLKLLGQHIGLFKETHEHIHEMRERITRMAEKYGQDPEAVFQTAMELAAEREN